MSDGRGPQLLSLFVSSCLLSGCFFPTLQSANIRKGYHLTAGIGLLGDQSRLVAGRTEKEQGADRILFFSPSYGFGETVGLEFGLPIALYDEDVTGGSGGCDGPSCYGFEKVENGKVALAFPYIKVASGYRGCRGAGVLGLDSGMLIYSQDLGRIEPYVSLKRIFSGSDPQEEDTPRVISRYQESNQSIWAVTLGVVSEAGLIIEVGVLRNRYRAIDPPGQDRQSHTDKFLSIGFGW